MAKQRSIAYVPWRLLTGIILGSLVLVIYFLIKPGPPSQFVLVVNLMGILYPLGLGILCVKGTRRFLRAPTVTGTRRATRRFTPFLLGMVLWVFTLSQIVWFVSTWPAHRPPGYPAPQHFIALFMYPFLVSAILVLPSRSLTTLTRLRLFLDSLLIMTAFATLCYYFILAPILVRGHGTMLEKIVASSFPQIDLLVIFCLLLVTLRGGETALRPVLLLLAFMMLGFFLEHVLHLSEILSTSYDPLSQADVFLFLSAITMTGAAQTVRRILEKGPTEASSAVANSEQADLLYPGTRLKMMLPSALVLIFGALVFWIWLTGGDRHFPGQIFIVYAGGLVVLLLMVSRQFLALHEINLLQKTLWTRNRSLHLLNKQLEQQASSDPLTGLPNHQALAGHLEAALALAREEQSICSLLFIDIDHFKRINDEYGHLTGDIVLCQFGELVASTLRSTDYLGRWGGEEFVAVLPGTSTRDAYAIAKHIRLRVARQHFTGDDGHLHLTCSLGIATFPDDASEQESLMALADTAMYVAKHLGRDQART
ncbi:MAG: GGDEF domain-containing protein, partial [Ktedonobacteraceae bacterium]